MNPLQTIASLSTAKSALDAAGTAAAAVIQPFADLLEGLVEADAPSASEPTANTGRAVGLLRGLLAELGAAPGDSATISFDASRDLIQVDASSLPFFDVERAIEDNGEIMAMLRRIAAISPGQSKPLSMTVTV